MRRLVASSFGLGFIPRRLWGHDGGAGTFGAALAVAVTAFRPPVWLVLVLAAVSTAASLWSAAPFAAGGEDPGWVCMDETAGTFVAVIGLAGWPWLGAIAVFRLVDITKRAPGMRAAEALGGSLGVTADDLVAGAYALAAGWLLALGLG